MPPSSLRPEDCKTQTPNQPSSNTPTKFALGSISKVEMAHVKSLPLIALAEKMNKDSVQVSLFNCQHLYNCFASS